MTRLVIVLLALALSAPAAAWPVVDRTVEQRQERRALEAAVRDLCGKLIVLLGENGFHGDGRTNGFKADLVRRLVQSCGFDAVFFEANHYDFVEISRAQRDGEAITSEMVSSAIGRVWNQNEEMAPLVAFLQAGATARSLMLGGLDDQLGSQGSFYSLERMPVELGGLLAGERRATCATLIMQRIWSDYPRDAPYGEAERQRVMECLGDIRRAAARGADTVRRTEIEQMVAVIQRAIAREALAGPQRLADRDRSMFQTLQWLLDRLPPRSKVIIWTANGHAQRASGLSGFEPNLGTLVGQAYGDRAFVLGFTAGGGRFRWTVRTAHDIPVAAAGSLEAKALGAVREVAYLGRPVLVAEGGSPGAVVDDHRQITARWADFYDGVVVFRAERPPVRRDE